jgi:hypothetical protein
MNNQGEVDEIEFFVHKRHLTTPEIAGSPPTEDGALGAFITKHTALLKCGWR